MPKRINNALTSLGVKTAKPGRHADGLGLHLLVKNSGTRSWVYRFMLNGRSRDLGIGPAGHGGLSLASAREIALKLRLKVKAGIDPLEERQQQVAQTLAAARASELANVTFRAVAESYISINEQGWRNVKHRQQWQNTLSSYVYPLIGTMPVADVGTSHVLRIIEPIWREKPETASRVRGRIEAVLDAAKARGFRDGDNPARWRGHIAQILPARSRLTRGHHKALPFDEVSAFMVRLQSRKAVAALALEFTILTAARTSETLGAKWNEVELDKAIWTVPGDRMKAGNEHRVPLSERAVEILRETKALDSDWLFPSTRCGQLSSMAMSMLLRRMQVDATVHGFRSSFRDWCAECTAFAYEVAEMALAHTIDSKVERAYRRGDLFEKRRGLMDEWASYCAQSLIVQRGVTPIRGNAAG